MRKFSRKLPGKFLDMVMSQPANHLYEFGPFRLDAQERLLQRDGVTVSLTPKAFDLLLVLIERHGHLLDKEELFRAVWPDSFVEESNLSSNIALIRKALGDGENGLKFIETVPKRGYRFIASVEEKRDDGAESGVPERTEPDVVSATAHAAQPSLLRLVRRLARPAVFVALALVLVAVVGLTVYRFRSGAPASALRITPVTSFQGFEVQPALSPEGAQAAFVWDQEQGDLGDIWVKLVDAGTPLQLTKGPANDTNPAWSPDGRHLAFLRQSAESNGVYVIPALGGPEVKLGEATPKNDCRSLDWSPDGKLLAVTDRSAPGAPFSIYLIVKETGEKCQLTTPPAQSLGDGGLAFAPDGKALAFIRTVGIGIDDIYLTPVGGGEAKRLTADNRWIHGLAWTADGRELVFSSNRGRTFGLWGVPVSGGAPKPFVTVGQNVFHPAVARGRNHLAYVQEMMDANLWRMEVSSATGRGNSPVRLIASTQLESGPQYSPDGKKIVFSSDRSGSDEIWVCDSEGEQLTQLTSFGGPSVGTPRWSPDGTRIVFGSTQAGQTDIYVISAEGGAPRRLTEEASEDVRPSWSRDGQWIYFGSNRNGDWQVWKMPADGGQAAQVTKQGGREAIESPDGKFVYYVKGGGGSQGVWRVPAEGGEETRVLDQVLQGNWAILDQGIYFTKPQAKPGPAIQFFSFATQQVTPVAVLEKRLIQGPPNFAVSPDGRWILYAQLDQSGSDIMLVENFR
jgi:Tol biopolymer transport system component/DNA-binding winged helix-turn-helix (wHTH) protein